MLTTEWVRAQWGQVGAGPRAHQALLADVQAPLQTPLGLSELILVQGLWPKLRLPGLKSKSSLAFPAGTEKGKRRRWAGHVLG